MKRFLYISILFFFAISTAIGQNKLANAHYSLKQKEYQKAKELIDAAAEDTSFMNLPATWYYKGHIYKELYKESEADNMNSPFRKESIQGFKKCIELEPAGQYAESAKKGLKYLSTTIYNQAASAFNEDTYTEALSVYEYSKEVLRFAYPETDFTDKDIMFNLGLAAIKNAMAEKDTVNADAYIAEAESIYIDVIKLDSNNISANYNLGIIYYNQGVEIVNHMDYSLDLMELTMIQDEIIALFRKSLPYMKKAYDLNPTRKETLIGLQGIYFSLNDIPQSELYKKELEALEGGNKPQQEDEVDEEVQESEDQ